MFLGLDYSYGWPNVSVPLLKPLGYQFVMRYLCYSRINSAGNDASKKRLLPGEVATLRSNGLLIGLNWEYEKGDQLGGAAAGKAHAVEAVNQAKSLKAPEGTAIYFSTDFEAFPHHYPVIDAYLAAARPIVEGNGYRFGQYGQYSVIKRSLDLQKITVAWQTYAWSKQQWDPRAVLRQVQNGITVAGGSVDRDECHGEAYLWDFC